MCSHCTTGTNSMVSSCLSSFTVSVGGCGDSVTRWNGFGGGHFSTKSREWSTWLSGLAGCLNGFFVNQRTWQRSSFLSRAVSLRCSVSVECFDVSAVNSTGLASPLTVSCLVRSSASPGVSLSVSAVPAGSYITLATSSSGKSRGGCCRSKAGR